VANNVAFLLGVFDKDCKKSGESISPVDFDILDRIASKLGVEADILFAVPDERWAGRAKDVTMAAIRESRSRVLGEITSLRPKLVVACGPVALKCLCNKGNATVDGNLRSKVSVPELDAAGIDCVATHSLEQVAAKPGMEKWLVLDTTAGLFGIKPTKWGKYTILLPDTPEWNTSPLKAKPSIVGLDLETYPGLDPWQTDARIRMCVVTDKVGRAWVVQARMDSTLPAWLQRIIVSEGIIKCGSNIKYDYRWLDRFGYTMRNMHDTSVAEHVLDCTNPLTDLKSLTFLYLPRLGDYSKEHRALVKKRGGWEHVTDSEQYQYCGGDGEASIAAAIEQRKKLAQAKLDRPFALSMALYPVLARMESRGARVDPAINDELDQAFDRGLTQLRAAICAVLGPINPNSPDQMADALMRAIPNINLTKQKLRRQFVDVPYKLRKDEDDDDYHTDAEVLEREAHKHPVIETILLYRRYQKLHGTYVKGLREKHIVTHGGCHYVHTTYREDVVETYRLSSQSPNMQNVPRKPEPDDDHPIPLELNIKRQYISRFKGGHIIEADQSQAEIRIAAHLSQDRAMLAALTSGEDVHKSMASMFLQKPIDQVTKLERTHCKKLTFLVLYGGGANTLAKTLGISKPLAKDMIRRYFEAFPELYAYIEQVKLEVKKHLYAESLFGYRRLFRKPAGWNTWDGFRVERQAWNHMVQNGAACCTFQSMIDLDNSLTDLGMKSVIALQVHDSIVVDTYPGEEKEVVRLITQAIESPNLGRWGVRLSVPLIADVAIGKSWGELVAWKDFKPKKTRKKA